MKNNKNCIFVHKYLSILTILCVIIFCNKARSLEAPQVYIPDHGLIIGTYLKMVRTQNIKAYLGIQYAEAIRFSPPKVRKLLNQEVVNATKYPPDCWQSSSLMKKENEIVKSLMLSTKNRENLKSPYDENCLFLNVFVPVGTSDVNGYAVIVWFHSGDFSYGSSSDINPFQLVFKQKLIVVTVSYRLNIFGFLTTGDGEAQGNYGLMDQSAALFWIRKNINYFGGNERQITIMGHSAGAVSVGLHLISGEWSKNTFNKAILMSGNPLSENAIQMRESYTDTLESISNIFGCVRKPTSLLIQCLKKVDAKILSENIPPVNWGPVVDYGFSNNSLPFIEDYPVTLFEKGMYQKVPVLMGVTDMEDILSIVNINSTIKFAEHDFREAAENIVAHDVKMYDQEMCINKNIIMDSFLYIYQNESTNDIGRLISFNNILTDKFYIAPMFSLANIMSTSESIYLYYFNIRPKTEFFKLPKWVQVPQLFEQIFVWGVPYMHNIDIIRNWEPSDKKISDIVMTLWANFVKSSNPTFSNIYIKWGTYNVSNKSYLTINEDFRLSEASNDYKVKFWNSYYPKILQFAMECCNNTYSSVPTHYINKYQFSLLLSLTILYRLFFNMSYL